MPLRVPAGRAGRPWLARRLEVARRGAEVLDEKRQALLRLARHLTELRGRGGGRVGDRGPSGGALAGAEPAPRRGARCPDGRLLQPRAGPCRARVAPLARRRLYPAEADVSLAPAPDLSALGGSSALVFAAAAHRRALEAAARYGAARTAYERVSAAPRHDPPAARRREAVDP